jgi:FtsZ-binding cell division protein ZapB
MSTPAPDEDSLASLEERIRRTVELVTALRAERDRAFEERDSALVERDAARAAAGSVTKDTQKLRQEIEELRGERKHVRTRIEKLLGQMDLLSGS